MTVLSRGSVVVNSDLWFNQPIGPKEAETQLKAGLQAAGPTELVIDSDRILITGEIPELARHRDFTHLLFIIHFIAFAVFFYTHLTFNWGQYKAIASVSFTKKLWKVWYKQETFPTEKKEESTAAPTTTAPTTGKKSHLWEELSQT